MKFHLEQKETNRPLTILGALRENPYTVTKMTEAYNNINSVSISEVPTTNLYVKFCPDDAEQLKVLFDEDLVLWDFPLEYEIVELGDYYDNPNFADDEIPCFYAVVDPNYVFPAVPYEILETLHIANYNSLLTAEAFKLTGQEYDGNKNLCTETDPNWPDCQCDVYLNTNPTEWAECIQQVRADIENTVNGGIQCVYTQSRKPGGRIQVEDTELGMQPVENVKVVLKDNWFGHDVSYTDENGCFKIDKEYSGKAWMRVKFKNDKCKIRGTGKNYSAIWQWLTTIVDHHTLTGPTFNNIEVNYNMWVNQGSHAHRYWGAATVNNALHEFHRYADSDGIYPPPNKLDIYIGRNHSYGYALMSGQSVIANQIGASALLISGVFGAPWAPIAGIIGWAGMTIYLPELYVGIDFKDSDRLKRLAYHEFAHASHFVKAGDDYWDGLVYYEIIAGGHGSEDSQNADGISLSESWAEFIGLTYAHRTYGVYFSTNDDYQTTLEETRNESPNHIPIGFFYDLIDAAPDATGACDDHNGIINPLTGFLGAGACGPINDMVSDYTISEMFDLLNGSTTSPLQFKDKLILGASSSTQTQVNNLFNSY